MMSDFNLLPSHYVGIGASAGGLEALQTFLQNLPPDTGASFIIVQHLSPDFKSLMAELLARHTSMPVLNAEDGVEAMANTVYIIPPKKNMLISEGRLLLSDRVPEQGHYHPINMFFRSLAEDQKHRTIGIVLSGTGSDGSRGINALKEEGGMVIVQEPTSARFDGMPISAMNTGIVDLVLAADEMGKQIDDYIQHPLVKGEQPLLQMEAAKNGKVLPEIFTLLKHKSGIDFSGYKPSTVARRIERRMTINQVSSLQEYLSLILQRPFEVEVLSKELLIGVTRFFRDEEAYNDLKNEIIPQLVRQGGPDGSIRVWIAGCSTGEEAYSMAMLFTEEIKKQNLQKDLKIFATDVDADAIAIASQGIYSEDITLDIPAKLLNQYFIHKGSRYQVCAEVRQCVIFAAHNLISDPPFSNMNLVTCRNLLIYLQQSVQRKVLTSFHFALQKEGVLFLGGSENLGDLSAHFEIVGDSRNRIFKKISNHRIPISSSPISNVGLGKPSVTLPPVNNLLKSYRGNLDVGRALNPNDRLVSKYAPPCILLDENFDAVHVNGDLSRFINRLPPGRVSANINDLVIDEISIAVSTALHRVRQTGEDVLYADVLVERGDTTELIDLSVLKVAHDESTALPRFYWLVLESKGERETVEESEQRIHFDQSEQARQRILDLETELKRNREHLQVTVEELETTNEELQSANEELMSANEELQSTNEELQSVNEELFTVNSEYQEKIAELSQANSDLDRVLKMSNIGIIFLDEKLTVHRFTNAVTQYINLVEGDIERPIHHISSPMEYPNFVQDISDVSATGEPIEKQIKHGEKSIMVYLNPGMRAPGASHYPVTVTFNDITRIAEENSLAGKKRNSEVIQEKLRSVQKELPPHKLNVLLVDDDPDYEYLLRNVLDRVNESQYELTLAGSSTEALEVLKNQNFDVCLSDYRLIGDTAIELVQEAVKINPALPFIVLTGYPSDALYAKLLENGIFDLIKKEDLNPEVIARSIRYAVQKRKLYETFVEESE